MCRYKVYWFRGTKGIEYLGTFETRSEAEKFIHWIKRSYGFVNCAGMDLRIYTEENAMPVIGAKTSEKIFKTILDVKESI